MLEFIYSRMAIFLLEEFPINPYSTKTAYISESLQPYHNN